jgi:diadenosine tetraphosphate (Ap4A) HIT family hydrolase
MDFDATPAAVQNSMTVNTFDELKAFILDPQRMRMSHVYKPLMIIAVLRNGGAASRDQIAAEFVSRDVFQLEHYRRKVVDTMPGVRLVRDGVLERNGDAYTMAPSFRRLPKSKQMELIAACEQRIEEFLMRYGDPFGGPNLDNLPAGLRYEILKRAGGRCELCGVSHEEVPLQVDHIIPRALGGSNDASNLQVLCRTCNADKRHLDQTDFRQVRASYDSRDATCIFCQAEGSARVVAENELAFVIEDKFPVTPLHRLIIPRRHLAEYFDLHRSERSAVELLLREQRDAIRRQDSSVSGFNMGVNVGIDAGQTVLHVHMHLIPRRAGDVSDPRGGVRGVIAEKQKY